MNKKEMLKTFDLAGFVSLVIATILVLIFQFTGNIQVVKMSLVMYAVAFFILTVFFALKTYFGFAKTKQNNELIVNLEDKQKGWMIAKLVLSVIVFIFSLVVVILY